MKYQIHKRLLSVAVLAAVSCVLFAGTATATDAARFNASTLHAGKTYD